MTIIKPEDNPAPHKVLDLEFVILGCTLFALWWHRYGGWQQAGVIVLGYGVEWKQVSRSKAPVLIRIRDFLVKLMGDK